MFCSVLELANHALSHLQSHFFKLRALLTLLCKIFMGDALRQSDIRKKILGSHILWSRTLWSRCRVTGIEVLFVINFVSVPPCRDNIRVMDLCVACDLEDIRNKKAKEAPNPCLPSGNLGDLVHNSQHGDLAICEDPATMMLAEQNEVVELHTRAQHQ